MDPSPEKFGRFHLATTAIGEPILLPRAWNEDVYLAFDGELGRLVELHVLKPGGALNSASDLVALAAELRGRSFMTVLVAGEEEGVPYYATNLSDGEMVEAYVARRGLLPSVTALCLMQSYLKDLADARKAQGLLTRMQLANPLVTTVDDVFLTLRVVESRRWK